MPKRMAAISKSFFFILPFLLYSKLDIASSAPSCGPVLASDADRIQFATLLEFVGAEFFLWGSLGKGLDKVDPQLVRGGPPPIGARKANLDDLVCRIIEEFGYQEVGHLRALTSAAEGLPRPPLDLRPQIFGDFFDRAMGRKLEPPMDPYANTVNYLLASYIIPYIAHVGYAGTIPYLTNSSSLSLIASLVGVEAGQEAVIRTLLYQREREVVQPYNITVAEFTRGIANLRSQLGMCGVKDEGVIVVDPLSGAENKTDSNVLSADANSLSYASQPQEILRILYGTGNERKPGGFLPKGGMGKIAGAYLNLA